MSSFLDKHVHTCTWGSRLFSQRGKTLVKVRGSAPSRMRYACGGLLWFISRIHNKQYILKLIKNRQYLYFQAVLHETNSSPSVLTTFAVLQRCLHGTLPLMMPEFPGWGALSLLRLTSLPQVDLQTVVKKEQSWHADSKEGNWAIKWNYIRLMFLAGGRIDEVKQ